MRGILSCGLLLFITSVSWADGPADNNPETVRRLPKLGIEVPAEKRTELEAGLQQLKTAIDELAKKKDARTTELLPDVQIFYKAVHDALTYQEFHDPKELDEATKQLRLGQERADALLKGDAPWTTQTGLVVRGYVSKIDGSVQPYGMVVPETYTDKTPVGYRCDIWLHGRGEVMTELNFIKDRLNNPGTFTPPRTLVLHPYGRWNNAFKFAGEVDVFEGLASVKKRYAVDDDRVSIRGFSMGGAGAWHLAVHYPDQWFAANPGAGFSETPDFLKVFQKEDLRGKPWWEERLWNLYDCNRWATNLTHVPTVAYSGADDSQKQAADVMERAMREAGSSLVHIVSPATKHQYSPAGKAEVEARLAGLAARGRQPATMSNYWQTTTLRYPGARWLQLDGLENHWQAASIFARVDADRPGGMQSLFVATKNVTDFSITAAAGDSPAELASIFGVQIDRQTLYSPDDAKTRIEARRKLSPASDGSWNVSFHKVAGEWKLGKRPVDGLRKKHGLQGPIDDAFLDSFLMVRPSGKAAHEAVENWTTSECDRAIEQWRRHFRGEARVKKDSEVSDEDLARHNLILWGDPSSNAILAKIADKLPITWGKDKIGVQGHGEFAADQHALISIYPNPLNPDKYIVLNSGFTFREYAHLNNARQVPMLPDWAVVDLTTPPGTVWPGKIVAADFFDEAWQVKKSQP